ncbi:MAG: UvrD-helicase domain-containing protein [Chitinophagales bacterium]|nr:UvrD-helicase domain-containing protein [Chitinophagales bacterium]
MTDFPSSLKIINASAGSGKTYLLAKSFVELLILNPFNYRHILAITFTKKATAEMKDRVLLFLQELAQGKNDDLKQDIVATIKTNYNLEVNHLVQKNALLALQNILHNYANFNITTIDSFFQHVIRSFAKELNLPIGLNIELDTEQVIKDCVDLIFDEYNGKNTVLSNWLEKYINFTIVEDKSWKIKKNIFSLGKELLKEEFDLYYNILDNSLDFDFFEKEIVQLQQKIKALEQTVQEKIDQARAICKTYAIDYSKFSFGISTVDGFLNKAKYLELDGTTRLKKMLDGEQDFLSAKTRKEAPEIALAIENCWHNGLQNILSDIYIFEEENNKEYKTYKSALQNIYSLALLSAINDKVKTYRKKENCLLINDANHWISKITKNSSSPFIYEKTGLYLRHLLIDEFQDTSLLQWNGVLPLIIEILSQYNTTVTIVGDPKQSIYRWRGGKMDLLLYQIEQDIKNTDNIIKKPLEKNYRSKKNIVDFNNFLFNTIKSSLSINRLENAYESIVQESKYKEDDGFIKIEWTTKENHLDSFLNDIQNYISQQQQSNQTINYKDIAILVRSNAEGIKIANHLQANNIPFISTESVLVKNDLSVQLIIALLYYIYDETELFYKYQLESYYTQYHQLGNLSEIFDANKTSWFIDDWLNENKTQLNTLLSLNLSECIYIAINLLNIKTINHAYILRFLDVVQTFTQEKETNISAFLNYWEEKKESIAVLPSSEVNAVQIMTVHKSKGLQFKAVFIPFGNWRLNAKANTIFWAAANNADLSLTHFPINIKSDLASTHFDKSYFLEQELSTIDTINLCYVAFTRAEEQLFVYYIDKSTESKTENNLGDLIKNTLYNNQFNNSIFENNIFKYGSDVIITTKKTTANTIATATLASVNLLNQSIQTHLANQTSFETTIKGKFFHQLMELSFGIGDISNYAMQLNATYLLTNDAVQQIIHQVNTTKTLFANNTWLNKDYQILKERKIIYQKEVLIPDIVFKNENNIVIIDYKTGAKEKSHETQIKKYQVAYTSIFNLPCETYLLYTDDMNLIKVD